MPTGYTAGVQDGTIDDFRTFALRCARAFGATIMQRDDPMDVPPAERQVEPYYRERVDEARARVAELATMTRENAEAAAEADYRRQAGRLAEQKARTAVEQARYRAMLEQAEAWEAPTLDHAGLKAFMVEQLQESIRFDTFEWPTPTRETGATWLSKNRATAAATLRDAESRLRDEEARCKQASRWVRQLYESLDGKHAHA